MKKYRNTNTFVEDLVLGESYERKTLDYLNYDCVVFSGGKSTYDFYTRRDHYITVYEVKSDHFAHRSSMLTIEFANGLKPSGISITEANIWVHWIVTPDNMTDRVFFIPTKVVKEFCEGGYLNKIKCGYMKRTEAYLLPVHFIDQYEQWLYE